MTGETYSYIQTKDCVHCKDGIKTILDIKSTGSIAIFNLKKHKQEDIGLKKALKDIQAMVTQANIRRNNRI